MPNEPLSLKELKQWIRKHYDQYGHNPRFMTSKLAEHCGCVYGKELESLVEEEVAKIDRERELG